MEKKFQEMFTKYDGNKGNAMAIARAMHMELENPTDITIHSLRMKIYQQRKLVNAQSEWAHDKTAVNAKFDQLYGKFPQEKSSNEEIATAVHRAMDPDFC